MVVVAVVGFIARMPQFRTAPITEVRRRGWSTRGKGTVREDGEVIIIRFVSLDHYFILGIKKLSETQIIVL